MKKALITVLSVLAFLSAFGQNVMKDAEIVRTNAQSREIIDSLYSDILGEKRAYTILLPRNYNLNTDKKYPVVYLLHGIMDTNEGWYRNAHVKDVMDQLVQNGEANEMIVVTPSAGGNIQYGVWNGYFNMPGWRYEDFFFQEFLPHVENKYRIIGNKDNRAIGGLSMGGGGSTVYVQRHPDMFAGCYAMSALMTLNSEGRLPSHGQEKMEIFNKSVLEHSAIDFVNDADPQTIAQLRTVKWFVDCGDDDVLFDVNVGFYQAMRRAGVPCELRVFDGIHNWQYWQQALYRALPFFSRVFPDCR